MLVGFTNFAFKDIQRYIEAFCEVIIQVIAKTFYKNMLSLFCLIIVVAHVTVSICNYCMLNRPGRGTPLCLSLAKVSSDFFLSRFSLEFSL